MTYEPRSELTHRTLAYVVESRPLHDRLNLILTQAAGYSLLAMTAGREPPMLDAPVALARAELRLARDGLAALRVPGAAAHHFHHVAAAAGAIERSLALLTACPRTRDDELGRAALARCLRVATEHLRAATRLLPGFEMVDARQACCAAHANAAPMMRG